MRIEYTSPAEAPTWRPWFAMLPGFARQDVALMAAWPTCRDPAWREVARGHLLHTATRHVEFDVIGLSSAAYFALKGVRLKLYTTRPTPALVADACYWAAVEAALDLGVDVAAILAARAAHRPADHGDSTEWYAYKSLYLQANN